MSATPAVIVVHQLRKSYNGLEALKGISFEVRRGEVFGLLGPNGAGKTTTVEILEGIRQRTSGDVTVLGLDPQKHTLQLKALIGVCLQNTNFEDKLRVWEAIELFASFYSRVSDPELLLKRLQLWEKRHAYYGTLSGGQKQRLALALALINEPEVLFLDEPTVGLDPQARREIRSLIEELRAEKRTILLTTHYIEEAERLCDRVAIIDEGRIIAIGPPSEIKMKFCRHTHIDLRFVQRLTSDQLPEFQYAGTLKLEENGHTLTVVSAQPAKAIVEIVKWCDQKALELEDLHIRRPTLEDIFIELTGKRLRD